MRNLRKVLSLFLSLMLLVSLNVSYADGMNSTNNSYSSDMKSTNPLDYEPNTEERYIANMAHRLGISFEEAKKINDAEVAEILKKRFEKVGPLAYDEEVRYKTVDKKAGTIETNVKSFNVNIASEIRYVWNRATNKVVYIENVGSPIMYISGFSIAQINGGGFNIEKYSTSARISQTASLVYVVDASIGANIQIVKDVVDVSGQIGTSFYITTKAKTFYININASDLN